MEITVKEIESMKNDRNIIVLENEWDNVNRVVVNEVRFMNMNSFIRVHDIMAFFGNTFEFTAHMGWSGVPIRILRWE